MPGCKAAFEGEDEDTILRHVARHAHDDHGMEVVPDELVQQVKQKIRDV